MRRFEKFLFNAVGLVIISVIAGCFVMGFMVILMLILGIRLQ